MDEGLWTEVEPSQFVHEREALGFVRRRLPGREPWRAWSNFTFVDTNGRPAELDLLVVAPRGVVLIEIKSFPDGVLDGDGRTWRWKPPRKMLRSYDNPFFAASPQTPRRSGSRACCCRRRRCADRTPRATPAACGSGPRSSSSSPQLTVQLNERGLNEVYGPDPADGAEQANRLPGLIAFLKDLDSRRAGQPPAVRGDRPGDGAGGHPAV